MHYNFDIGFSNLNFYMQIRNLFDRKNAVDVYKDTGSAEYSLIPTYVPEQPLHSLDDYLTRPDYFSQPREIIFGINLEI